MCPLVLWQCRHRRRRNPHAIQQAARLLKNGAPTLMILGNGALRAGTIAAAYKIALATGAKIVAPNFNALIERGGKRSPIDRIPYVVEPALLEFSGIKQIILIGTAKPPFFFAYPSKPASPFPGDAHTHVMTRPEHDQAAAMAALAIEVGALGETGRRLGTPRPHPASGSVTSEAFAQSLTALLSEDTIIADEGLTFGRAVFSGYTQCAGSRLDGGPGRCNRWRHAFGDRCGGRCRGQAARSQLTGGRVGDV